MTPTMDSQELARRFNEDEAVWRRYEQIRELRRRFGTDSPLSEEALDHLDWLQAELECRTVRAIGFFSRSQT
jgi:hypothetical protein